MWAVGGRAEAHALLIRSVPSSGATVPPGSLTLTLYFTSRIDASRSRLTLEGPHGAPRALPMDPSESADELRATTEVEPGDYTVLWVVLAVDGHITRGRFAFTVARG
jgi:methionine-rich copper-binding protein CopC